MNCNASAFQTVRRRLLRWIGLALVLVTAGGCVLPPVPQPSPRFSSCRPNVFIYRGAVGYWPALSALEMELCDRGVQTTVGWGELYRGLADDIAAAHKSGDLQGPLVIVGYSSGATAAINTARRLKKHGIIVDKLVLLETTLEGTIPENVHECVNIYKPQPLTDWIPILRGIPVEADDESSTSVVNYDLRQNDEFGDFVWEHHLTLSANPLIHEMLADEVLSALEE